MAKFTVVTPARDAGAYIDGYFTSLSNQTIGFAETLHCIVVLDGPDEVCESRISAWQALYPLTITCLVREQAGASAARNAALSMLNTPWVTFIDADDFVDVDFFASVDAALVRSATAGLSVGMAVSRMFQFHDASGTSSETKILRHRFAGGGKAIRVDRIGSHPYLHVAGVTMSVAHLRQTGQMFDERIGPRGEDTQFVNAYLASLPDGDVVEHAGAAVYQHRQHTGDRPEDRWLDPQTYDAQLRYGILDLLGTAKRDGAQPQFIQAAALFHICQHLRQFVDRVERWATVPSAARQGYLDLLACCIRAIPLDVIRSLHVPGVDHFFRVGMLRLAGLPDMAVQKAFVGSFDPVKRLIQVRYYSIAPLCVENFRLDGTQAIPLYPTVREHRILETAFAYERIVWLPIEDGQKLTVDIGNRPTFLSHGGRSTRKNWVMTGEFMADAASNAVPALLEDSEEAIIRQFVTGAAMVDRYRGCWLLADRDSAADDNAEHLYRYLARHRPDLPIVFALRSDSPDWDRLRRERFNLVDYGSLEFKAALIHARFIVSSQTAGYMYKGLNRKSFEDLIRTNVVFLQHGVIKDDLSSGLSRQQIDMFVTSSWPEYWSIAADGRYGFSDKQTVLTGLPRHDRLVQLAHQVERQILVMPTWRGHLVGPLTGNGSERAINPDFHASDYARAWSGLLSSGGLAELLKKTGYSLVFCPHPNVQPYLDGFAFPEHIKVTSQAEGSLQDLFTKSAIMITDYSSVAFEMALLRRAVIYYQFDEATFFGGSHTYEKGYFGYREDGFGPVLCTEDALLHALASLIRDGGAPAQEYLARVNATFAFGDDRNCARVLDAILKLDSPEIDDAARRRARLDHARRAVRLKRWNGMRQTWGDILAEGGDLQAEASFHLGLVSRAEGKRDEAREWLDRAERLGHAHAELQLARAGLSEDEKRFARALRHIDSAASLADANAMAPVQIARRRLRRLHIGTIEDWSPETVPERWRTEARTEAAAAAMTQRRWDDVFRYLEPAWGELGPDDLLQLAKAYRLASRFYEARQVLDLVDDSGWAEAVLAEEASIASARKDWHAALILWSELSKRVDNDERVWRELARSKRQLGDLDGAKAALAMCEGKGSSFAIDQEVAMLATQERRWDDAAEGWRRVLSHDRPPGRFAHLRLAEALAQTGETSAAHEQWRLFQASGPETPQSVALGRKLLELNGGAEA